jgi:choline dehydrogenase
MSGVGEPARLRESGIELRHALPGVGENLQDHLQLRVILKVNGVKTLNRIASTWWGKAGIGLEYLVNRSGPMSMAPSQLGAFAKSDPGQARANVEFHVQPLSLGAFGEPLHGFDAFTASVCSVHVQGSRGEGLAPVIAPNYLSTEEDLRVAADSIRLVRRIAAAPALQRYRPQEWLPGPAFQTEAELREAAGKIGTTIFHPVGTCAMGRDADGGAVVDARLRVHGLQGLRIADASIMPLITSGNTNSPTIMIAERAADMIREDAVQAGVGVGVDADADADAARV